MGQTLSEPVTEKHTTAGQNEEYAFGFSEMQGWRITMEDAHCTEVALQPSSSSPSSSSPSSTPSSNGFFAVYDGHGGSSVAKFTGATLHTRMAELQAYKSGRYEEALKKAFITTDEALRASPDFYNDPSGCTAVGVLATHDGRLICANAGDSRAVLCLGGLAKPLSFDHKPTNEDENKRIVAAGGYVEYARVNGNLALSRAIGDFEYKQNYSLNVEDQIVTANPEITVHENTGEEEFMIVACDGIWDCLSSQHAIDLVRRGIASGLSLEQCAELTMDRCLAPDIEGAGVGCDNMSVIVVAFLKGKTLEEWSAWVKKRVTENHGEHVTPDKVPEVFGPTGTAAGGAGDTPLTDSQRARTGKGLLQKPSQPFSNLARVLGQRGLIKYSPDEEETESEAEANDDDDDDTNVGAHVVEDFQGLRLTNFKIMDEKSQSEEDATSTKTEDSEDDASVVSEHKNASAAKKVASSPTATK